VACVQEIISKNTKKIIYRAIIKISKMF